MVTLDPSASFQLVNSVLPLVWALQCLGSMETKTRVSYDIAKFAFEQAKTYYSFGAGKARYVAAQAAFERALDALTKEDLEALNALRQ